MHSVELLPDPVTERAVVEVWRRLRAAGLPSQAAHRHPTNRPHLTLGTAATLPPETRDGLRRALAVLPLPLRLDGTVRFTGRTRVLAWRVRPDDALLRLQETVWRTLRGTASDPDGPPNPLLAPDRWAPHVTLGRGRGAAWPDSDEVLHDALFRDSAAPDGVLAGRWTAARAYDSADRTTERVDGV
ncbi:2'-5' RNA ligase family protein [Streptomyces sp. CRN 30]|uniref:2'-5' RNA ligase family protein n=1 Tax=Streptomyces sp. CRN 30 TaxID=3075613 RepID=UPI002A82B251|nr:2'-5' RNA ligase family protein [Streptomyces sp. CRN 30]